MAGPWYELSCPHLDGTSDTFNTSHPTGLDPRQGCIAVNLRGADVPTLWARARAERPKFLVDSASVAYGAATRPSPNPS